VVRSIKGTRHLTNRCVQRLHQKIAEIRKRPCFTVFLLMLAGNTSRVGISIFELKTKIKNRARQACRSTLRARCPRAATESGRRFARFVVRRFASFRFASLPICHADKRPCVKTSRPIADTGHASK
jgi:hypothetical protein